MRPRVGKALIAPVRETGRREIVSIVLAVSAATGRHGAKAWTALRGRLGGPDIPGLRRQPA